MTGDKSDTPRPGFWIILLSLLTVACVAPFCGKAVHMDDPLFVWSAKQMRAHPFDPYGFTVNWYGKVEPMSVVMKNPPLAPAWLAGGSTLVGWSEVGLHLLLLPFAVLSVVGTFLLARRWCRRPHLAALIALFTPVLIVSGTSLMCDVMMLAFWVWAILLWVQGLQENRPGMLCAAAVLMLFAALAKYFGACLIPLLAAYTCFERKRFTPELSWLLLPLIALGAYEVFTRAKYGSGLFSGAVDYAVVVRAGASKGPIAATLVALAFVGGGLLSPVLLAPLLWNRRQIFLGICLLAALAVSCGVLGAIGGFRLPKTDAGRAIVSLEFALFILGGLSALALTVADVRRSRSAESWLLALWIFGTFVFAGFANWTVNGRAILPMAPALAIVLVRRLDSLRSPSADSSRVDPRVWFALSAAAVISLGVACADYALAGAVRKLAVTAGDHYAKSGRTIWFQGHWGFQYYLEQAGARALARDQTLPAHGDVILIPRNNTNTSAIPESLATRLDGFKEVSCPWLSTMSYGLGAMFYAGGPLPFGFGKVLPEECAVFVVN